MDYQILNEDATSVQGKFFDKNGKTTFQNFKWLRSQNCLDNLIYDIRLIRTEDILSLFSYDEISAAMTRKLERKHQLLKDFMLKKHNCKMFGNFIAKDDDFIQTYLEMNLSLKSFNRKLKLKKFSNTEIDNILEIIENIELVEIEELK